VTRKRTRQTAEKILVLDRGAVELAYPRDWTVEPDPAGHLAIEDPTDSCKLEISCFRIPAELAGKLPSIEVSLAAALNQGGPAREILRADRPGLEIAYVESRYETDDTERGERRRARSFTLVALNGVHQALLTFACWEDDVEWAIPAWERMIATLRLGNAPPLEDPRQHWALRKGKRHD
jgi:hypothetical protein